jgi:hypothetical protein
LPAKISFQQQALECFLCYICSRAIPFNEHNPLWTRSIKFEPLRKKDQSADTNTPQKLRNFALPLRKKTPRSKDAEAHNPSETAFSNPLRNYRP